MTVLADVRLHRERLASALALERDVELAGHGPCTVDALATTPAGAIVIVDMTSPRALALVAELARRSLPVRVVALAVPENEAAILACVESGVSAFVGDDAGYAELLEAVRGVAHGAAICPASVAAKLMRGVRTRAAHDGSPLTRREREIAALLAQGLANKEIAARLCIALPTVKNHVHHILEKLDVSTRRQAVAKLGSGSRDSWTWAVA